MPRPILEHTLRIDPPNILKDLMHRALQLKRPEVDLGESEGGGFIGYQWRVCSVLSLRSPSRDSLKSNGHLGD